MIQQVSVCTSQVSLGQGQADVFLYQLWLLSLRQLSWTVSRDRVVCRAQETISPFTVKVCRPRVCSDDSEWVIQTTLAGVREICLCVRLVWRCIFFFLDILPHVQEAADKMNGAGRVAGGCSAASDSSFQLWEAKPGTGDAGNRGKSEIMFLLHLPTSTHTYPPERHIMITSSFLIPIYKQILGQEVNKYNRLGQVLHTFFSGRTK